MIGFYPQIRHFHIFVALLSGTLFALRGAGALAGARWPQAAPLRWASVAIDTALLTAALMLLTLLPHAVFANGWLTVKVCLVATYIGLGAFALHRARTPRGRTIAYLAALAVFFAIYATARTHSPLGLLQWLSGG